jgi:hypothetical protein
VWYKQTDVARTEKRVGETSGEDVRKEHWLRIHTGLSSEIE